MIRPILKYPSLSDKKGFTLAEVVVALTISIVVFSGLLGALFGLQRTLTAVQNYATASSNQARISDSIALDVRRAITISYDTTTQILTLTIPDYYGTAGATPAPNATPVNPTLTNGIATYTATPITITYYLNGTTFYRSVNGVATPIANNLSSFTATMGIGSNTITCQTTFVPQFVYNTSATSTANTTSFTSTYVRNSSAR